MSLGRLLVLTTSFPRHAEDDAGIFVARLISALAKKGAAGTVLVPADTNPETLTNIQSFAIERVRYGLFKRGGLAFGSGIMPNLRRNPLLILQVPGLLIAMTWRAIDLVKQDTILMAHWIVPGIVAWLIWIFKGNRYTITVRGEDFRLLKLPLIGRLLRPVLKHAHALVTINQEFASSLKSIPQIRSDRVHCIENGCDNFNQQTLIEPDTKRYGDYLLFVGTVIPRKRIDVLLDLLASEQLSAYSLVICGRMEDQELQADLERSCASRNISHRVHFLGAVAPPMVASYLIHAAAYVTASEFEGRPNAVLEALAMGKIVLASDISAHREIITDSENGLLFEMEHTTDAACRLHQTLRNAENTRQIEEAARASVKEFTWEQCAIRYLSLFKSAQR